MSFESPSFESVEVGDALPKLDIDITPSLIVGGAIASRDFTPVHHDVAAAQAQGYAGQGVPPRALPPQMQQQGPPGVPQPGQPAPAAKPAPPKPGKKEPPETMKAPLGAIGRAMMSREDPQIVGEMIFNLADHHRYFRMLPEDWADIFTEPAAMNSPRAASPSPTS